MSSDVIILAGGLGTRLRSVVGSMPKPLAPVGNKPFLAYLMDRFSDAGVRHIILATGYKAEAIRHAIGESWRGARVSYSREDAPRGTGGAIAQAIGLVESDGAHVVNGDTYLEYDVDALARATSEAGLLMGMALARVDDTRRYGLVEVGDGIVLGFREKAGLEQPGWINAGAYYLSRAAFARLPDRESFSLEKDFIEDLVTLGQVAAFTSTHSFIDIGVPEDYSRAQSMLGT